MHASVKQVSFGKRPKSKLSYAFFDKECRRGWTGRGNAKRVQRRQLRRKLHQSGLD